MLFQSTDTRETWKELVQDQRKENQNGINRSHVWRKEYLKCHQYAHYGKKKSSVKILLMKGIYQILDDQNKTIG